MKVIKNVRGVDYIMNIPEHRWVEMQKSGLTNDMRPADADAVTTNLHINKEVNNEIQDLLKKNKEKLALKEVAAVEEVKIKEPEPTPEPTTETAPEPAKEVKKVVKKTTKKPAPKTKKEVKI
jgi:outer membrane biosynthesis protein TonB